MPFSYFLFFFFKKSYLLIVREFLLVKDSTYHFLYITYTSHISFFSFFSPISLSPFLYSFYIYTE